MYCKEMNLGSCNQSNEPFFTKMLSELHICLGCKHNWWRGQCSTCESIKLPLLEIMHKGNVLQNLSRRLFISQIMIYCVDTFCDRVFYKIPCLKEDSYVYELPNLFLLYITALFVEHHPNKPHSL